MRIRLKINLILIFFIAICAIVLFNICANNHDPIRTVAGSNTANEEFDKYLKEFVGISATPGHIVIKDNKIINHCDFLITEHEFKNVLNNQEESYDLYTEPIVDINNNKVYLKDYDYVYITKNDCDICKKQSTMLADIFDDKYIDILTYHIDGCEKGCD